MYLCPVRSHTSTNWVIYNDRNFLSHPLEAGTQYPQGSCCRPSGRTPASYLLASPCPCVPMSSPPSHGLCPVRLCLRPKSLFHTDTSRVVRPASSGTAPSDHAYIYKKPYFQTRSHAQGQGIRMGTCHSGNTSFHNARFHQCSRDKDHTLFSTEAQTPRSVHHTC